MAGVAEQVVFKKKQYQLKLTQEDLLIIPAERKGVAHFVNISDCYGVRQCNEGCNFEVFSLVAGSKFKRTHNSHLFTAPTPAEAQQWTQSLEAVITGTKPGEPVRRRRILIFINPFGGTKKAVKVFEDQVKPVFNRAPIDVEVIQTTHAGHAKEFMAAVDVSKYDAFATVSGDGLLHEVLNGLMSRSDWREAMQKPLGIIPCGSGNAMARTLETPNVLSAALAIVKGHSMPLDLIGIRQPGHAYFGHLLVMWGLVADIDIESEKYRWAGSARFTFSGIGRIMNLRKYRARLSYLPWFADTAADATAQAQNSPEYPAPPSEWLPVAAAAGSPAPLIEGDFVTVLALNTGWQSTDAFLAPYSSINDGCLDLVYILGDVSTTKLASIFLDLETGKHVHSSAVHYVKVRAFVLEPLQPQGTMDVDGELVENVALVGQAVPSAARILCPQSLQLPSWDSKDLPRGGLRAPSSQPPPTSSGAAAAPAAATGAAAAPPAAAPTAAASSSAPASDTLAAAAPTAVAEATSVEPAEAKPATEVSPAQEPSHHSETASAAHTATENTNNAAPGARLDVDATSSMV